MPVIILLRFSEGHLQALVCTSDVWHEDGKSIPRDEQVVFKVMVAA